MKLVRIDTTLMLDATDHKIINLLWQDARFSYAEIARQVKLSAPAVIERIRKLEDNGVITGYRASINPEALGHPLTVFILAKVFHMKEQDFIRTIKNLPEVIHCHNVTGEKAFLIKGVFRSSKHLDDVLEKLAQLSETSTMLMLSETVSERLPQ